MKKIFYSFAALLFFVSACKKDPNVEAAKSLLVGTWNNVNIKTKIPSGTYLKLKDDGGLESTTINGYNSYEVKTNKLVFKGSAGTRENVFTISSDSLYIEPNELCTNVDGCGLLFARQK